MSWPAGYLHFKCPLQTFPYSIYALIVYSFYEFLSVFLNLYDLVIIIGKLELRSFKRMLGTAQGNQTTFSS